MSEDFGHGIAIAFDNGFFAEPLSLDWDGINKPAFETSSFSTTGGVAKYRMTNLTDPGQLRISLWFDPANTPALLAGDAPEECTITWTNSNNSTWAASMGMTDFAISAPDLRQRVRATATLKVLDIVTIVANPA